MLLCLDFDGVLHHSVWNDGLFAGVPKLAQWLERWPGVDIVISSSWRMAHSREEMVEMLGPVVGGRVIGCTPVPPRDEVGKVYGPVGAPRRYERQSEIEAWLASSWHPDRPWVALDDMAFLFQPDCQRLVVCDGRIGITEDTLLLLDDHAARAGLVPVSVALETRPTQPSPPAGQVVIINKYLKHTMSCLPDGMFDIVIDHPQRLITIFSTAFDSHLVGWLVTSILPQDVGIKAYRDDDGWTVQRPAYRIHLHISPEGPGSLVEMEAEIVKLSRAMGGGVAVRWAVAWPCD